MPQQASAWTLAYVMCIPGAVTIPSIPTRRVDSAEELQTFLMADPINRAYQLGDLDPSYLPYTTWYGAGGVGELRALVLVYTGLSLPVLITCGDDIGLRAVLEQYGRDLPRRAMLHMPVEHLEVVNNRRLQEALRPMVRMGMAVDRFKPVNGSSEYVVRRLGMADIGAIMELFAFYRDNFFEPAQLSTGHYYGIELDGRLASVAGVHVFSPQVGVACVGNIVTHPDFRGRGLSTECTSFLCSKLADSGVRIFALNVERSNASAIRVYQKIGFSEHSTYLEGEISHGLIGVQR